MTPSGPSNARILICGEAPGENEERLGQPFVGASGQELSKMLQEAGIMRSECFLTNVCRCRPANNDMDNFIARRKKDITPRHVRLKDKWVLPVVVEGHNLLHKEIDLVKPKVIIALGNTALWSILGLWGIKKWRGSMLTNEAGLTVIPAYHPAAILREWGIRAETVNDFRRAARYQHGAQPVPPAWRFSLRPSLTQALEVLGMLKAKLDAEPSFVEFDLETRAGHIACAGLSWSPVDAICLPFMCVENQEGFWTREEEPLVLHALYLILKHPNAKVRGQNLLYDSQYTYRHWHFVPNVFQDTMITHHTAFSGLPKSLAFQASLYCEHYIYWKDDGKEWTKEMGEEQLWSYNCVDCVRTRECCEGSQAAVDKLGLHEVNEFQQSMFWPVLQAMIRGVKVDQGRRNAFAAELFDEITKREEWFLTVLGHSLNPKSAPQMKALFYDDLNQPIILHRKTRQPTLDDEALAKIGAREPLLRPLIRKIQEYRSLGVFLSTFVSAPLDIDSRMRCAFNICGTETYRLSSSENAFGSGTNLQNTPEGGDEDSSGLELPNVRRLFIPDDGFTFFDTDLSAADLRIVVRECGSRELQAMLDEGRNPYVEVAREYYKDSSITKQHPKYTRFKSFAHGTHYLGSARGLAGRIGMLVHEIERVQAWYFGKFPEIKEWQEDLKKKVRATHKVTNAFGYQRFYFDRIDDDVFRQAAAWIGQSTTAVLINKIWKRFYDNLPAVQVLLQVHDSLAGQFPSHRHEELLPLMAEQAHVGIPYPEPLFIPIAFKTSRASWGECS